MRHHIQKEKQKRRLMVDGILPPERRRSGLAPEKRSVLAGSLKVLCVCMLLLMISLGLSGFSYTVAYFHDTEAGFGFFRSRALDITIHSTKWPRNYCEIGSPVSKTLWINNEASVPLLYTIETHTTGGNYEICNAYLLRAELGNETVYYGPLKEFEAHHDIAALGQDEWFFSVSIPGYVNPKYIKGARCEFDFVISSGQGMLPFGLGFYDTELDHNVIKARVRKKDKPKDDYPKRPEPPKPPAPPSPPIPPWPPRSEAHDYLQGSTTPSSVDEEPEYLATTTSALISQEGIDQEAHASSTSSQSVSITYESHTSTDIDITVEASAQTGGATGENSGIIETEVASSSVSVVIEESKKED